MKTTRKISEQVIPIKIWNKIEVERINYSYLTEDERKLLEVGVYNTEHADPLLLIGFRF